MEALVSLPRQYRFLIVCREWSECSEFETSRASQNRSSIIAAGNVRGYGSNRLTGRSQAKLDVPLASHKPSRNGFLFARRGCQESIVPQLAVC